MRATAAVCVLAALLGCASASDPPAPGPVVGVQYHGMWSDYTDPERAAVLDRLAAAGVQRVRIDVSWAGLQPNGPDSISLEGERSVDRVLTGAIRRGLRPLVTLWLTPSWANGGQGERTAPDDPADYGRIAEWAAARWAGRVDWEVWNEPNSETFFSGADPAEYARLLCAAHPAFRRGDPGTTVVSGGPEYNDAAWLSQTYDAGAGGCFDALATHPYPSMADQPPDAPDDGTRGTFRHLSAVRDLMVARGDAHRPIWLTEVGWSTHPGGDVSWRRGVTEEQQADYVTRTLALVRNEMPYVTAVFFYRDRDHVSGEAHFDHFGLMTRQLQPKPALDAIGAAGP